MPFIIGDDLIEHAHAFQVNLRVRADRVAAKFVAREFFAIEERDTAAEMARQLSWGTIHRLWQMLLKGLQDVEIAPDPREAAHR